MADEIFNQIAKEAMDSAIEETSKYIETEIKSTEQEVKLAAQKLVQYADSLQMEWNNAKRIAASLGPDEDPVQKVYKFQKKMIKSNVQFREVMKYVLDLQNKINSFLGQKVQMVYTYIGKNGQVEVFKFDNDVEHLKIDRASQSHGGGITGRIRFSKKALSTMEKMVAAQGYDVTSLDATFKEVHERALISKTKAKMGGAFYVFWNTGNGWKGSRVTGMGALGEAYFNFFINEYTFTSFMEEAVGDYMMNPKYGVQVGDNASGFLQGDVSRNGIEYGVKAGGASALSYVEIIDYARQILATQDLLEYLIGNDGKSGLKNKLAEEADTNLARKVLAEELEDEIVKTILSELQNKGKGNSLVTF